MRPPPQYLCSVFLALKHHQQPKSDASVSRQEKPSGGLGTRIPGFQATPDTAPAIPANSGKLPLPKSSCNLEASQKAQCKLHKDNNFEHHAPGGPSWAAAACCDPSRSEPWRADILPPGLVWGRVGVEPSEGGPSRLVSTDRTGDRTSNRSHSCGPQRADPPAGSSNHIQNTFKTIGTFPPAFHSGELGIGWLARIRQEWLTILVIQACIFAHLVDPYVSIQRYFTYFATKLVQNGEWLSQPFGALEVPSFLASLSIPKPRLDLTHQI